MTTADRANWAAWGHLANRYSAERPRRLLALDGGDGLVLGNVVETLQALMSQAAFDQDLSCRTFGRCTHGNEMDGEVGNLIPQKDGVPLSLDVDQQRAFLYTRYDAQLTWSGLAALNLSELDAASVNRLDAVDAIPDLARIGRAVARRVSLDHFGEVANPKVSPLYRDQ